MRFLLVILLAFYCNICAPVVASTTGEFEVQRLYESACGKRPGVWTKEIRSMNDLRDVYNYYVEWRGRAVFLEDQTSNRLWRFEQMPVLDEAIPKDSPVRLGTFWRNQLVEFAGEETVSAIEPRALQRRRWDFFRFVPHGIIDLPSGRLKFVPTKGLVPYGI